MREREGEIFFYKYGRMLDIDSQPHKSIKTPKTPKSTNTSQIFWNSSTTQMGPCCVQTPPPAFLGNNQNPETLNYCQDFSPCTQGVRQYAPKAPPSLSDAVWSTMLEEAAADVAEEPILATYYTNSILSHASIETALANHLASKLETPNLPSTSLAELFIGVLKQDKEMKIINSMTEDLRAVRERDPACISYVHCFLNFKGFLAIQSQRIAHTLWLQGRSAMAYIIQNRVSEAFAVDIHPGARIGHGILLDHATGVVIGETAVIGNNVSILHNVTLGGTGKVTGIRHPEIGDGVLIGAGTCVLGNVRIGDGAKVGAGSVVLREVPPKTTAVGNPARLIGGKDNPVKLDKIPSFTMDHTFHISGWSDYVI